MIKFIHTADWQLGMTRTFLEGEAQARYSQARIDAIRRIAKLATEEQCDFVTVGGDVFESNLLSRQTVLRSLDALRSFTVPVFLLPGNHDPLDITSIFTSRTFLDECPANVQVLGSTAPVRLDHLGVEIVGAPWDSKRPLHDLVSDACSELLPEEGTLRVVVGHGAVDTVAPDVDNPAIIHAKPVEAFLRDGIVHFVGLGDRHSATQIGSSGRFWYSGTPLVTAFEEVQPNRVLLVELDATSATVEERSIGEWQFLSPSFDLGSEDDVDALERWFDSLANKQNTVVKLSLVGTISLTLNARLQAVLDRNSELLASLDRWERHDDLHVLPSVDDVDSIGLSGFASGALHELLATARAGGDGASDAEDALALLFRLAGGTR